LAKTIYGYSYNDLKLLKRTEPFKDKGHLNIIKKYIN